MSLAFTFVLLMSFKGIEISGVYQDNAPAFKKVLPKGAPKFIRKN
jgi:hypothetical protein